MASSDDWSDSESSDDSSRYSEYVYETDSDEDAEFYSSGAFQNVEYSDLDYDTGDDMEDPAFAISMGTRSKTSQNSIQETAVLEGDGPAKKRSRARVSDSGPLDPNKRRRTGGPKGKGPAKAKPHPPIPQKRTSASTNTPPSNPAEPPPSKPATGPQNSKKPTVNPTMPHIHPPNVPKEKKSFKEWVDKLLSKYVFHSPL
jgi:hypothetical protein